MPNPTLTEWLTNKFTDPLTTLVWPEQIPLPASENLTAIYDPRNSLVTALHDPNQSLSTLNPDQTCSRLLIFTKPQNQKKWQAANFTHEGTITNYWGDGTQADLWSIMTPTRANSTWQNEPNLANTKHQSPPTPDICRVTNYEDAPTIHTLMHEAFPGYQMPDDPAVIKHALATGAVHGRGIFATDGTLLAYASAEFQPTGGSVEITDCATIPAARGQGLMAQIITALVADLEDVFEINHCHAFAREDQPAMQKVFKKLGWEERGRLVNHFKVDDTWLSAWIWGK